MTSPTEGNQTPKVISPSACAESCRKVRAMQAAATQTMRRHPDVVRVIVCDKKQAIGCGANVFTAGIYDTVEGERRYYENPGVIETFPSTATVSRRIERAIKQGAVEHTTLDPL